MKTLSEQTSFVYRGLTVFQLRTDEHKLRDAMERTTDRVMASIRDLQSPVKSSKLRQVSTSFA